MKNQHTEWFAGDHKTAETFREALHATADAIADAIAKGHGLGMPMSLIGGEVFQKVEGDLQSVGLFVLALNSTDRVALKAFLALRGIRDDGSN